MRTLFFPKILLFAGAALMLAGCASLRSPALLGLSVSVQNRAVIAQTKGHYGWGYLSHPFAVVCPGKGVLATWNTAGDGGSGPAPKELEDMEAGLSADGGATWLFGKKAYDAVYPYAYVTALRTSEGLVYEYGTEVRNGGMMGAWITPDGKRNGKPQVPVQLPENSVVYLSKGAVACDSHRWLIPGYTKFRTVTGGDEYFRTILLESTDQGASWAYLATVATHRDAPWGQDGPCEPALALLPDGDLVCVMRTGVIGDQGHRQSEPMLLARSSDGGRMWKSEKMTLAGVMPKLLLMSNGVLVCAFGAPGNNLAFSVDGGRNWGRETALVPANTSTTGYVDVVEVAPDRLLAVYDTFGQPLQRIWLWEPPPAVHAMHVATIRVRR